jgi:hypothetical protein
MQSASYLQEGSFKENMLEHEGKIKIKKGDAHSVPPGGMTISSQGTSFKHPSMVQSSIPWSEREKDVGSVQTTKALYPDWTDIVVHNPSASM